MNYLSKSLIILFSEVIWIYFVIAMFVSVEMNIGVFVNATWWVVAGIGGYVLNALLARNVHYLFVIGGNVLLLVLIIIQNWKSVVLEGSWVFGLVLTVAISFVFIRSASFVYREPSRRHMLHRFEGNVIFYALLALVFTSNQWGIDLFHIVFLFAIFSSLIGMILTLQNDARDEENEQVEVRKVGQSGWFTAVISMLLIGITLVSSLLFLPAIRTTLYTVGMGGLGLLKWLSQKAIAFLTWVFSLFPESEIEGTLPEMTPADPIVFEEISEEVAVNIPYGPIVGGLGVIAVVLVIWLLAKYLKRWQPPKSKKSQHIIITRESLWAKFLKKCLSYMRRLKIKWRFMFPRFFNHPVYWYYHQVQKWGRKNGFHRLKSETSREYIEKIIKFLAEQENDVMNDQVHLVSRLRQLNQDYQATYYGNLCGTSVVEYKHLVTQLKNLQLSKLVRRKKPESS